MSDERSYYEHRAEAELELARQAADPRAGRAHYYLAGMYLDRVYGPGDADMAAGSPLGDAGPHAGA